MDKRTKEINLADKYGLQDDFSVAEFFDNEAHRIEKLFCFPEYPEMTETETESLSTT